MKTTAIASTIMMICAAASSPLHAQTLESWGASDYWDVMVDSSLGDGCLIQSEFNDGPIISIGFDPTRGGAYVTAFNMAWGEIEEGGIYSVLFSLDGEDYDAEAHGIYLKKTCQGLIFSSTNLAFCLISQ